MEILLVFTIGTSSSLFSILILWMLKPLKFRALRLIGIDLGTKYYYCFKKKIYIFPKKQETRVSVSVLARIEDKNGKFLLKSKTNEFTRQDTIYKPLGGAIKITDKIHKKLVRYKYFFDQRTRYTAKEQDFRIFMNLNNNKIIQKALYGEKLNFYKDELIREISEEMLIKKEIFKEIFSFKQNQPIAIHVNHTKKDFSHLGVNDYVHHIIFDLKIKDEKKFEKVKNNNKKAKINFINLNGQENKSITSLILNIRKQVAKFKES